jgi:phosphoglucomutase/phosphomannomutase
MNQRRGGLEQVHGGMNPARAGFAALQVDPPVRKAALEHLERWLTDPEFTDYRPLLEALIEKGSFPLLLDCFYQVLPFGTGGRRGPVGPGPNRFNAYTLATSVAGHLEFLRERFGPRGLRVVIGYDPRAFHDARGLYPPDLLGPLAGVTSRDFAELASRVYTSGGVEVYLSDRVMATPELSYAIRRLKAQGGLVISASHNPPDDNGGKFYDARGGQEIPPEDQAMVDRVAGVTRVEATGKPELVHRLPAEVHASYLDLNLGLKLRERRGGAKVVYTPLHGTGGSTVGEVLAAAGFTLSCPAGQEVPDGRFPTVPFAVANPEVPESMQRAIDEGRRIAADLVLATDPDADRIGAAVPDAKGGFRFLSGNEIGALVVHEVLHERRRRGTLPARPIVMKTEVTSELVARVARNFGAQVIDDLLVGFKYVAAVLDDLERTGRHRQVTGGVGDFVAGVEESHGVLLTAEIRDKDSAGPALVLAELAARVREEGGSILEVLDEIHRTHGVVANRLTSMVMRGATGKASIERIQEGLRRAPPAEIGGQRVQRFVDHWDESPGSRFGPIRSETDRAARNVLVFHLEGAARIIIRPSGTEPKNKTYIEAAGPPLAPGADLGAARAEMEARARRIEEAFLSHCLGILGVRLPAWAHRISGLVALDDKVDFAERFVRELEERAAAALAGGTPARGGGTSASGADDARRSLGAWIDARLKGYGRDPRLLTGEAMRAYVESELKSAAASGDRARVPVLELMREVFRGDDQDSSVGS